MAWFGLFFVGCYTYLGSDLLCLFGYLFTVFTMRALLIYLPLGAFFMGCYSCGSRLYQSELTIFFTFGAQYTHYNEELGTLGVRPVTFSRHVGSQVNGQSRSPRSKSSSNNKWDIIRAILFPFLFLHGYLPICTPHVGTQAEQHISPILLKSIIQIPHKTLPQPPRRKFPHSLKPNPPSIQRDKRPPIPLQLR